MKQEQRIGRYLNLAFKTDRRLLSPSGSTAAEDCFCQKGQRLCHEIDEFPSSPSIQPQASLWLSEFLANYNAAQGDLPRYTQFPVH